jgi:hypothetical protein
VAGRKKCAWGRARTACTVESRMLAISCSCCRHLSAWTKAGARDR